VPPMFPMCDRISRAGITISRLDSRAVCHGGVMWPTVKLSWRGLIGAGVRRNSAVL
jgi:hypothetical protein